MNVKLSLTEDGAGKAGSTQRRGGEDGVCLHRHSGKCNGPGGWMRAGSNSLLYFSVVFGDEFFEGRRDSQNICHIGRLTTKQAALAPPSGAWNQTGSGLECALPSARTTKAGSRSIKVNQG